MDRVVEALECLFVLLVFESGDAEIVLRNRFAVLGYVFVEFEGLLFLTACVEIVGFGDEIFKFARFYLFCGRFLELLLYGGSREWFVLSFLFHFNDNYNSKNRNKQNNQDGNSAKDKQSFFIILFVGSLCLFLCSFLLDFTLFCGVAVFDDDYLFFFFLGQLTSCFLLRL